MPDFRKAFVRDVMQNPVSTIEADKPLAEAAACMYDDRVSCVVIDLGDPARSLGILTQKDILGALTDQSSALEDFIVEDIMAHPVVTVPPSYDIETCIQYMRMLGVRRAPVVEAGALVGIISFTDIYRFAMKPNP